MYSDSVKVGGAVVLVPVRVRPVLVRLLVHVPVPAAVLVQGAVQVLDPSPVLGVGGMVLEAPAQKAAPVPSIVYLFLCRT